MAPNYILRTNAVATAVCAIGMLTMRETLWPIFGLDSPVLLDGIAIFFLGYSGALAFAARGQLVDRRALIAFAIGDAVWVIGSVLLLLLFWEPLAPVARVLVIAVALIVETFATLQYRAARHAFQLGS